MPPDRRTRSVPIDNLLLPNELSGSVDKALSGNLAKAGKAQNRVVSAMGQFPSLEPVLGVFHRIQQSIVESPNLGRKRELAAFLERALSSSLEASIRRGQTEVTLSDEVMVVTGDIIGGFDKIVASDALAGMDFPVYGRYIHEIIPGMQAGKAAGKVRTEMVFLRDTNSETAEENHRLMSAWGEWRFDMAVALEAEVEHPKTDSVSDPDKAVDLLKQEPPKSVEDPSTFFTREIAGMSLGQISNLPFPLGRDDAKGITEYLLGLLNEQPSDFEKDIVQFLFFEPKAFISFEGEPISYRHQNLFANLSLWQEELIANIFQYYGREQHPDAKGIQVLKAMDRETADLFMIRGVYELLHFPGKFDPDSDYLNHKYLMRHPIFAFAIHQFLEENSYLAFDFVEEREVLHEFVDDVFSVVIFSIDNAGLTDKFSRSIEVVDRLFQRDFFGEERMGQLKSDFREHSGGAFLEKLNEQSNEIDEITGSSWDALVAEGVHFLPMSDGLNIITFSEGTVPHVLGINQIRILRTGELPNWKIRVGFDMFDGKTRISGEFDQDGNFACRIPIKDEMPGMFKMLHNIAVMTFHDLTIQEQNTPKKRAASKPAKPQELVDVVDSPPLAVDTMAGTIRSTGGTLPRTQSDKSLIENVYGIRRVRRPHIVELHRVWLEGAADYMVAVDLYNEAVASGMDQATIEVARGELEEARRKSKKASPAKVQNVPKRLQLESIVDPVTGEVRYVRTWRKQHPVPKVPEEEERSPRRRFERRYSSGSHLDSLNQMLPWLINGAE